jgi:hypothetical protein
MQQARSGPVNGMDGTPMALQNIARQLAAQAAEEEFVTVNMVMLTLGDSAKHGASVARSLSGLTALALERFGGAQANDCQNAPQQAPSPCLAGVDPFDGQLLRFCEADSGYQFHGIGPDLTSAPGGHGDLTPTVLSSPRKLACSATISPPHGSREGEWNVASDPTGNCLPALSQLPVQLPSAREGWS